MKKHILDFLFGESQIETEMDETREALDTIFEAAEDAPPIKVEKAPLAKALKVLGVNTDTGLELDPEGFSLCLEPSDYTAACRILRTPDSMEKLAEMGWVATFLGDIAMTGEPEGEYRIRFISIYTPDPEDSTDWPAPNPKLVADIIKKGREFATTPVERDPNNPVKDMDAGNKKAAGVGKEKEGDAPEGKPKGSAKAEALVRRVCESDAAYPGCGSSWVVRRKPATAISGAWKTPTALPVKEEANDEVPEDPSADLWRCPGCGKLNCWNWQDADAAQAKYGEEVAVATGSAFDNVCGHCHRNFVRRDSPIQAEVYTHEPYDVGECQRNRRAALGNRRGRTGLGPFSEAEETSFATWFDNNRSSESLRDDYENYKTDIKSTGETPKSYRAWARDRWSKQQESLQKGKKKTDGADANRDSHKPDSTLEQLLPAPPVAEASERDVPYFDPKAKRVRQVKWVKPDGKSKPHNPK